MRDIRKKVAEKVLETIIFSKQRTYQNYKLGTNQPDVGNLNYLMAKLIHCREDNLFETLRVLQYWQSKYLIVALRIATVTIIMVIRLHLYIPVNAVNIMQVGL